MNKLQIFSKYLPYGATLLHGNMNIPFDSTYGQVGSKLFNSRLEETKIYLRPLESLTEEEWLGVFKVSLDVQKYTGIKSWDDLFFKDFFSSLGIKKLLEGLVSGETTVFPKGFRVFETIESLYALNVDIHGAIEKGFAVDKSKMKL